MVRAEIDFTGAATAGEVLAVTVVVEKLGRSSLVLRVEGEAREAARSCWQGRFTCVFMDGRARQSIPIPDEYRAVMEQEMLQESPPHEAASASTR
jgi:4-hydroxybenzoyl-CoA thioesterase